MESVYVACIEYKFSGAVLPVNASIYLQRVLTGLVQEKEFTDCVCVVVWVCVALTESVYAG